MRTLNAEAFNRTSMELKQRNKVVHASGDDPFNRTSMELKRRTTMTTDEVFVFPFNRTSMELKHAPGNDRDVCDIGF